MYIVTSRNKLIGVYDSFGDALKALLEAGGGVIYRGEIVVKLSSDEVLELTGILAEKIEPIEVPVVKKHIEKRGKVAIVLDQMYKGFFTNVLAREFPSAEIHEIVGRGLPKRVKVENIVKQPAQDDFDVLNIVEKLSKEGYRVIFFTGDKRLATQVSLLEDVDVVYAPPNEFTGKEALAKYMIEEVKKRIISRG